MKRKSIKTLQIIAILLQALAVGAVSLFTLWQAPVKELFLSDSHIAEIQSIPIASLLTTIPFLLIYIIGMLVMTPEKARNSKVKVVIFMVIAGVLQVLLQYIPNVITALIASLSGASALASYASLESALSLTTNPLKIIAFALFCLSCGGFYGLEENVE